jgi:hypothetical protein
MILLSFWYFLIFQITARYFFIPNRFLTLAIDRWGRAESAATSAWPGQNAWLTMETHRRRASRHRRWRSTASWDARVCVLELGGHSEATGDIASSIWSPELAPASLAVAVSSGQVLKSDYD